MASNIFTTFLERHNADILEKFGAYLAGEFPTLSVEAVKPITGNLVPFFIGRMLGTLSVDSELSQRVIGGALEFGLTPAQMHKNIGEFFIVLNDLRLHDPVLSKSEQEHVQRVLVQSEKFLLLNVFLVKPENLKSD